jgi:hypothetical protein
MNTKVGLIVKNKSNKFLLVKEKIDPKSKIKSQPKYVFPTLELGEEDTIEFAKKLLIDRVLDTHDEPDEAVLSFEDDEADMHFFYLHGDYDLSKEFYQNYESFLYVGLDDSKDEISQSAELIFETIQYIDSTNKS